MSKIVVAQSAAATPAAGRVTTILHLILISAIMATATAVAAACVTQEIRTQMVSA